MPSPPSSPSLQVRSKRQRVGLSTGTNGPLSQRSRSLRPEMPLDILTEVAKYSEPDVLLAFVRTCRFLRQVLLSRRSSDHIWKNAFSLAQPEPPPCPDDLTLPQYANLLYGNCYYCDSKDRLRNAWLCYKRVCKSCMKQNFIPARAGGRTGETLSKILPSYTDYETSPGHDQWMARVMYQRDEYVLKMEELAHASLNRESQDQYIRQEAEKLEKRKKNAEIDSWDRKFQLLKKERFQDRRRVRRDAFGLRVANIGEGYRAVFDRLRFRCPDIFGEALPGIDDTTNPLTSYDWEDSWPRIVEALELWRQRFEAQDKSELIARRTSQLLAPVYNYYLSHHRSEQPVAPQLQQLAEVQPFKSLLGDTPSDVQLAQSDFLAHLGILPQLFEAWKQGSSRFLLGLLEVDVANGKRAESSLSSSVLEKATSIFQCTACSKAILYPAILSHSCTAGQDGQPRYRLDKFRAHEEVSRYAKAIIRILGEDPDTVTWKQLEEARQRIECTRCRYKVTHNSVNKNNCLVMNWRQAIIHDFEKHAGESEDHCKRGWRLLDVQSYPKIRTKEIDALKPAPGHRPDEEYCVQCNVCDIQDNRVIFPPSTGFGPVPRGGKTCNAAARHDLAIHGVYRRQAAPSELSSWPFPVRMSEASLVCQEIR